MKRDMSAKSGCASGANKLQKHLFSFAIFTLLFMSIFSASQALAQTGGSDITQQMGSALDFGPGVNLPSGGENAETATQNIVGKVIRAFISVFGIIFLVLMIFGGYKWMMASGREEEVKKAKDTIRAAIIGLIIVMGAYTITFFITKALQSAI